MKNKPLKITSTFGGKDGEEQNALNSAIHTAAINAGFRGQYPEYAWLGETPKTSIVVGIVESLHLHGYKITKKT